MVVLGIETSCDETAMAVLKADGDDITIKSSVVSSQIALHAEFGGVVPNLAAREHIKNIDHVLKTTLKEAGLGSVKEIDLIAVTEGPGLGPALLVGVSFARALAWKNSIPIIGANHLRGHTHSAWLNEKGAPASLELLKDPGSYPILSLIVSGGHTELVLMNDLNSYALVGETHDDAIGEAFDKVARLLGLGYPGGPAISKLALEGAENRFELPLPMIHSKDFNFSYSGLKTAVLYLIRDITKDTPLTDQDKADIAASFQKAAVEVVVRKTMKAANEYSVKKVILSGGVSANKYLREKLSSECKSDNIEYAQPRMEYTTDNAAMIAIAGYIDYISSPGQKTSFDSATVNPNLTGYDSAFK